MPHRPERPAGATATAGAASSASSAVYSPSSYNMNMASPMLLASAAQQIMRPVVSGQGQGQQPALQHTTSMHNAAAAGVVTPTTMARQQWMVSNTAAGGAGGAGVHRHNLPSLPYTPKSSSDSADQSDRSTATKHEDTVASTLATESTANDEMDRREAALLLVSSKGMFPVHSAAPNTKPQEHEHESSSSDAPEKATMPLKKRKKHLDFLRRNQDTESTTDEQTQPCHVSPVSHSSLGSTRRSVSSEEHTPQRRGAAGAHRTNSYDSKESPYQQKEGTQELLDSSKIHSTTDIAPPATVMVPHFPSVLHRALSDNEFAGTVISWLPNGEAWKVLRWDTLRREVLPLYFADLRDEDGNGCGTIDAFLWHLSAWGFEEVTDGTDVGAYRHGLFIRGAQKLCSKMRFTTVPSDSPKGPNTVSPGRVRGREEGARSILQVPSLASHPDDALKPSDPNKRTRYEEPIMKTSEASTNGMRRRSPVPPGTGWPVRPMESFMIVNGYRTDESPYGGETGAWGQQQYYSDPSVGMRHMGQQFPPGTYDPRYPFRHHDAESIMRQPSPSQYSPPRVRSTRGRAPGANRAAAPSPAPVTAGFAPMRSSFPVSNRGKGSRRPAAAACRPAVPCADLNADRTSPVQGSITASAEQTGAKVQRVAVAISRKTKRPLPLARKTSTDAEKICRV